jgi:hypothetical protein
VTKLEMAPSYASCRTSKRPLTKPRGSAMCGSPPSYNLAVPCCSYSSKAGAIGCRNRSCRSCCNYTRLRWLQYTRLCPQQLVLQQAKESQAAPSDCCICPNSLRPSLQLRYKLLIPAAGTAAGYQLAPVIAAPAADHLKLCPAAVLRAANPMSSSTAGY